MQLSRDRLTGGRGGLRRSRFSSRRTKILNIASPERLKNCTEQDGRPMNGRDKNAIRAQFSARMWPPIGLLPWIL